MFILNVSFYDGLGKHREDIYFNNECKKNINKGLIEGVQRRAALKRQIKKKL